MVSLGVAGTAKNTGKTTTIRSLMATIRRNFPNRPLAVTSIGYDGESVDQVTGLPKPSLPLETGDLVAICAECIGPSRAGLDIIEQTDLKTALGPIVIARVMEAGKVVVAGPTKRIQLRQVLRRLEALGSQVTIVDGALGRIIPMGEVDELIIATGASRNTDPEVLAEEIAQIDYLLNLPHCPADQTMVTMASVLNEADYQAMKARFLEQPKLMIQGLIPQPFLERLVAEAAELTGRRLIFDNPLALLLAGDKAAITRSIHPLRQRGIEICSGNRVRLRAVTINPFYPKYIREKHFYEAAYIDQPRLYEAIQSVTLIPVYDVVRHGTEELLRQTAIYRQLSDH